MDGVKKSGSRSELWNQERSEDQSASDVVSSITSSLVESSDSSIEGHASFGTKQASRNSQQGSRSSPLVFSVHAHVSVVLDEVKEWASLKSEERAYLTQYFIADARIGPKDQALRLRTYAGISRLHYVDSVQALNAHGFEEASMCSTRWAVPQFLSVEDLSDAHNQDFRLKIARLVALYDSAYIDLSHNWKYTPHHKNLRAAATQGLLSAGQSKHLRIDLSNYRYRSHRQGDRITELTQEQWKQAIGDKEAKALVLAFRDEIIRVAKLKSAKPSIDLLCQDQPLESVVYPLVKCLATYAGKLSRLQTLDLNCFTKVAALRPDAGSSSADKKRLLIYVQHLARVLVESSALELLSLRMNSLNSDALALIAVALERNVLLQRLDLSWNPLCSLPDVEGVMLLGVKALAKALQKNTVLTRLNLSYCGLNDAAADLLQKALDKNYKLDLLDLSGNSISHKHLIFEDARVLDRQRLSERGQEAMV
jgi:hypothetical protein